MREEEREYIYEKHRKLRSRERFKKIEKQQQIMFGISSLPLSIKKILLHQRE